MDLGNIPGFYFDPQKKRYFKITDGARLPPSVSSQAVYEHGRYQRHERNVKRARIEESARSRAQLQRVKRAAILSSLSIPGVVLSHASASLGSRTYGDDAATVHVKQYKRYKDPHYRPGRRDNTLKVMPSPDTGQLLVAMPESVTATTWNQHDIANVPNIFEPVRDPTNITNLQVNLEGITMHVHDGSWTILCPMGHSRYREINIWRPEMAAIHLTRPAETFEVDICNSSMSQNGRILMAYECGLYTLDDIGAWTRHGGKKEARNARWTNERTILTSRRQKIYLHDTRAVASAQRFQSALNITGIQAVPDIDWQFVASTNRAMKLYDLRMVSAGRDRYTLEFPGEHWGRQSSFGVSRERLLAAWQDAEVKVMSLRDGRFITRLELPEDHDMHKSGPQTQIGWSADSQGSPYVYGCFNSRFIRWSANSTLNDAD